MSPTVNTKEAMKTVMGFFNQSLAAEDFGWAGLDNDGNGDDDGVADDNDDGITPLTGELHFDRKAKPASLYGDLHWKLY